MENNRLSVRMNGNPVGVLEQNMVFYYLKPFPENQIRVSLSLPLSMDQKTFSEDECKPFFEGLLPESAEARKAIARRYKVSPGNTFGLLRAIGKECAGAISFHEMDEPVEIHESEIIEVDYKTDKEIEKRIKKLPTNPLWNGIDDIRISLAGIQDKACIYVDHFNPVKSDIGIPKKATLSTHILKPDIKGFKNSAYNEYFCLRLAGTIGLEAAPVFLRKIGKIPCLIVERYDRRFDNTRGKIKRLHQEDFCQALGKLPSQKYQEEGGPSLEDCFKILGHLTKER